MAKELWVCPVAYSIGGGCVYVCGARVVPFCRLLLRSVCFSLLVFHVWLATDKNLSRQCQLCYICEWICAWVSIRRHFLATHTPGERLAVWPRQPFGSFDSTAHKKKSLFQKCNCCKALTTCISSRHLPAIVFPTCCRSKCPYQATEQGLPANVTWSGMQHLHWRRSCTGLNGTRAALAGKEPEYAADYCSAVQGCPARASPA